MATSKVEQTENAIVVKGLKKSYKDLEVLSGIDFTVKRGTIMALLGPNGAGKTTTIRILSTLLLPDGGSAQINGHDVVKHAAQTRGDIGLTGQYAAVDGYLTGKENLMMVARLYRLSKSDAADRSTQLLKDFDLTKAADRPVKNYSGGMKRRLDLAMSLIASPPIIFLDEPTTGLDPRSRMTMWSMIKKLADSGTTILLTTQYMDEADQLANNIVVIDNGKVIAKGDSNSLKAQVGADHLDLVISKKSSFDNAMAALAGDKPQADTESRIISIATKSGVGTLKKVLQKLEDKKIVVESVNLRRPTLDDVFLTLTGHGAEKVAQEAEGENK